ncbi:MAG: serine/threonine protein kinase [Anaerolineales bacterium]|nr:serine/threonine protein kinase [Anaerolineales bacterium]
MPFANGENVGSYRILAKLGQGGVATVYKAYHPALDRLVAIKVLHPAFKEDPNFLERFRREARVIARLEHPNIVPIYDFSEQNEQPYLVMKYIEGVTLKARLAQSPLDPQEGLRIVEAVGQGLSHAHERGVLHRDVKPSNILLENGSGIYLADFGLARIAAAGESTLSSDMLMGTPQYISPEQAQGEKDLDPRTDIYSFGVVLYEIVVGRVPFQADTPFSIIHDHIYTPLPLPTIINPQVPITVERVLLKALAKSRNDRFDDVQSMVNAFRTACEGGDPGIDKVPAAEDTALNYRGTAGERTVSAPVESAIPGSPPILAEKPKKSGFRWVWLGVGIIIACISALAILSLLKPDNIQSDPENVVLSHEQAAAQEEILAEVENYANAGEAIREAELLSGDGFRYADEGMFIEASRVFIKILEIPGLPVNDVNFYKDLLFQMLYLAAGQEGDMTPVLDETRARHGDNLDLYPVELRSKLFLHGPEHIMDDINQAVERQPNNLIYRMLRAEVWLGVQNEEQFYADTDFILGAENVPEWILNHVEFLLTKFEETKEFS